MFTGIIESLGTVRLITDTALHIEAPSPAPGDDWQIGESVSIDGCCLTVVSSDPLLSFDMSEETLRRTTLVGLKAGSVVNIERAMKAGGRFGGHIVQGHVDATGEVLSVIASENSTVFRFSSPEGYGKYLMDKGSIAVNGISLTVVRPIGTEFEVWTIPHTLKETNLKAIKPGDRVNLEFDVIAKYVERLLAAQ